MSKVPNPKFIKQHAGKVMVDGKWVIEEVLNSLEEYKQQLKKKVEELETQRYKHYPSLEKREYLLKSDVLKLLEEE